jgi:hypothetical protein
MKKASWTLFVAAIIVVVGALYSYRAQADNRPKRSPETAPYCNDEAVAGLGGFNDEAFCPKGSTATGGGYELVTSDFSQLLGASVNESMPVFSGTTPNGWEVVGVNTTTIAGKIRVCVLCAQDDNNNSKD